MGPAGPWEAASVCGATPACGCLSLVPPPPPRLGCCELLGQTLVFRVCDARAWHGGGSHEHLGLGLCP